MVNYKYVMENMIELKEFLRDKEKKATDVSHVQNS